jgi:sucrose synthase
MPLYMPDCTPFISSDAQLTCTRVCPAPPPPQQQVLGMPDTGGQVVYILDQVRALEAELDARLAAAGLRGAHADVVVVTRLIPESQGTMCHVRLERINGTAHARILRTPFRDAEGRVLRRWVSRFDLWPFLERWVIDATADVLAELNGKPDFVVGNYSDGNMAATLMCHKLKVTQCNIAHALEKTKVCVGAFSRMRAI